jgi:hypothetical protein
VTIKSTPPFESEGEFSPIHVTALVKILTTFENSGEPGVSSRCDPPINPLTAKFHFATNNSATQVSVLFAATSVVLRN